MNGPKIQTSNCKIKKYQECKYNMTAMINTCGVYLKVVESVDLRVLITGKEAFFFSFSFSFSI